MKIEIIFDVLKVGEDKENILLTLANPQVTEEKSKVLYRKIKFTRTEEEI